MKMDEVDGKKRGIWQYCIGRSRKMWYRKCSESFFGHFSVLQCVVSVKLSEIREKILVFAEF